MLFNAVFSKSLAKLQKDMEVSFSIGGDQSPIDDFAAFLETAPENLKLWNAGLIALESQLSVAGFDTSKTTATQAGMTGISASATEETMVAMVGQTMAMRVDLKYIQTDLKVIQETGINALELTDQSLSALNNAALELLPDNESAKQQKQATAQLANETLPVYAIASAIHKHGLPKSLIFINESGMAIDLLDIKELSQENAFNELLDNMTVS